MILLMVRMRALKVFWEGPSSLLLVVNIVSEYVHGGLNALQPLI